MNNPLMTTAVISAVLAFSTSAAMAQEKTATLERFPIAGEQLTPVILNNLPYYLVTSEITGLQITDEHYNVIAKLEGHYTLSDILNTDDKKWWIAALNNNTLAVDLFTFDSDSMQFSQTHSLPSQEADTESVCLTSYEDHPVITITDALGVMHQHVLVNERFQSVRDVATGPGITDCAVSTQNNTIYLADENAGLWQYANNWEADNKRTLSRPDGVSDIASVAVTKGGVVSVVSPSHSAIWMKRDELYTQIRLPGNLAPEVIRTVSVNGILLAGLYDDNTEALYTVRFSPDTSPAVTTQTKPDDSFMPVAQTAPVNRFGDAADDPAIWYFDDSPAQTVILGTDKKAGLDLYDLEGERLQHLPVGRVNNVDVRTNWRTEVGSLDIAAASNRSNQTVDIFILDRKSRQATHTASLKSGLNDLYGLCMYLNDNQLDVLVNDKDGGYERHRLSFRNNRFTSNVIDTFTVPSQPEGCVADDENGVLFYGEEDEGIWQRSLTNREAPPQKIAGINQLVRDDIEGLSLFSVDGEKYLIASSQGNHRYAVYATRAPYTLLGTFNVVANLEAGIDGASETDGIDSISLPLGERFPEGLLVVQDGHNVLPSAMQNFKLVSGTDLVTFIRQRR